MPFGLHAPDHGGVHGEHGPRQHRGMQSEDEGATAGGNARNSQQGRSLRWGHLPGGIPFVPFIPPNPGESRIKI